MLEELATIGKYLGQTARLMVGVPDYDVYTIKKIIFILLIYNLILFNLKKGTT